MYKIYMGDEILHNPKRFSDGYVVLNAKITQELNSHGSLSFVVTSEHPCYDDISIITSLITVYDDTERLFCGRVIEVTQDFYKRKTVYCEGELAFLCDSYKKPFGFRGSPSTLFKNLITRHNGWCSEDEGDVGVADPLDKTFTVGEITVEDPNDYINRSSEYALSTWEVINTRLIDTLGGYLRVRVEDDVRYIDYIADYENYSDQTVRFGENLLDLEQYVTGTDVITCLFPYGAQFEEDEDGYTEQPENGEYNGNRVTISSIEGYESNRVYSETGLKLYGRIWGTNVWDDVTEPANLLTKAQAFVDNAVIAATTITIKAIDLHLVDVDVSRIHLGDYVRVISKPHDIDTWLQCTRIVTDLSSPENTEITLGAGQKTLTGLVASG